MPYIFQINEHILFLMPFPLSFVQFQHSFFLILLQRLKKVLSLCRLTENIVPHDQYISSKMDFKISKKYLFKLYIIILAYFSLNSSIFYILSVYQIEGITLFLNKWDLSILYNIKQQLNQIFLNYKIINKKLMIRRFHISNFLSLFNKQYQSSSTKIMRDDEQLSQNQIQQILGLQPPKKQSIAPSNKQIQTATKKNQQNQVGKVRQLFYNLIPTKNQNFPICVDPEQIKIQQTPNQNIFNFLQLTKTCSYDQYSNALSKFRNQTELYGDQSQKSQLKLQDLQFKGLLVFDSPYIQKARERTLVNISIPGSIEVQDPRNFMELRPIQQFRHTPLIPISQSAMKKHQQMLEQYHRRQFVFQVKQESVVNFFLISTCMGICFYLIYLVLQKQQQRTVAYSRLKFKRTMGQDTGGVTFKI